MEFLEAEMRRGESRREILSSGKKSSLRDRKNRSSSSMEQENTRKATERKRRRFVNDQLPSPPPDPRVRSLTERAIAYENSATNSLGVEDAFDHLDKLHAMIQQILAMREKNAKLFRRVRDLERLRVTKKAHAEAERSISMGQELVLPDEDVGFAESLLGAMLSSSFELSTSRNNAARSVPTGRVTRSRSVGMEHRRVSCPITVDTRQRIFIRPGPTITEIRKKRPSLALGTPKVSKWTRVKAAFKWERAACTNADNLGIEQAEVSVRYLKIPENVGGSSEVSGPPTPAGTISSSSSIDDVFHRPRRPSSDRSTRITGRDDSSDPTRRSRSLDGDASVPMNFVYGPRSRSKIEGRPPRVRVTGESSSVLTSLSKPSSTNSPNDFVDLASRRLTPTLTITVPSSEELRSISSPESITPSPPSARQSFESEKTERYSQAGYETPKESRTGQVSPASSSSGILRYGLGRSKTCQGVPGDYRRQQSLKGESLGSSPKMQRRDSKWNKVKRAFLTSATSVPTSPSRISSYFFDDGDATGGSYSASASAEDLENDSITCPGVQAEIQRNYRLLHDKLGTEFYRKLAEWERLKYNNQSVRDSSKSNSREKENENMRLLGEERLTPEFKKKLEEWKRMNKGTGEARGSNTSENRSVNRRRITDWQLWRSPSKPDTKPEGSRLSDDFIKKMEEWKRIKSTASRRETEVDAVAQPRGTRIEGQHEDNDEQEEVVEAEEEEEVNRVLANRLSEQRRRAWKSLEDEEFRSLEKVLEAMEMDRQTRLSKLQRIVGSQPQKTQEVLIHTSTGLYRFEGISRKFTRKLYEWEKSQGISPELSTFRLLEPLRHGIGSPRTRAIAVDSTDGGAPRKSLYRSKSVGCVDIDSWRTTRDNEKTIRRPCSLSLNDIDNLDARSCIIASSVPTIPDEEDTSEDIAMEDSEAETDQPEPEAVIVDIEDVIEETASPMTKYQPHQTPVYSVAGSETTSIAIPLGTVTARHEPSPVILIEPGEMYPPSRSSRRSSTPEIVNDSALYAHANDAKPITNVPVLSSLSTDDDSQLATIAAGALVGTERGFFHEDIARRLSTKSPKDVDENVACNVGNQGSTEFADSEENWQMAPLIQVEREPRNQETREKPSNEEEEEEEEGEEVFEDAVVTVRSNARHSKKLPKTRRLTDTQVGYHWRSFDQPITSCGHQRSEDITLREMIGDFEDNPNVERIIINEDTLNKIVVPTALSSGPIAATLKLGEKDLSGLAENPPRKEKREATSVFVKTKRIVFSPFRRESKNKMAEGAPLNRNVRRDEGAKTNLVSKSTEHIDSSLVTVSTSLDASQTDPISRSSTDSTDSTVKSGDPKRPPLPQSPILARKEYRISSTRETSPSIRMMIRRYNEKLETEGSVERGANFSPGGVTTSSANSSCSGSSSPSWRTPMAERRFQTPPDRYDGAKKALTSRKVSCCASCSQFCDHSTATLAKSASASFFRQCSNFETRRERTIEPETTASRRAIEKCSFSHQNESTSEPSASPSARAMKIRRAREHFLSMGPGSSRDEPEEPENEDTSHQLESSKGSENCEKKSDMSSEENDFSNLAARIDLVKSASAGMINIDANTYERLQFASKVAAETERACESLPRSNEHLRHRAKEKSGRLSQLANKFKRARLRRSKDKESTNMNTVSTLCRQSLLVDIAVNNPEMDNQGESSKSKSGTRRRNEGRGRSNDDEKNYKKSSDPSDR